MLVEPPAAMGLRPLVPLMGSVADKVAGAFPVGLRRAAQAQREGHMAQGDNPGEVNPGPARSGKGVQRAEGPLAAGGFLSRCIPLHT